MNIYTMKIISKPNSKSILISAVSSVCSMQHYSKSQKYMFMKFDKSNLKFNWKREKNRQGNIEEV